MAEYTTGHCPNHNQPGGCQLHNLQCGWPNCDRRQVQPKPPAGESGVHPDALPDGTLSKSTAKRVTALAAASVSERARELLAGAYRVHGHFEYADILLDKPLVGEDYIAAYAIEQALTQQRGECEDAHKFRRLAQLLDGFDFRLGRNALMPPATYLDSVEITCEFQPGVGQSVIDAIVDVLATEKRND